MNREELVRSLSLPLPEDIRRRSDAGDLSGAVRPMRPIRRGGQMTARTTPLGRPTGPTSGLWLSREERLLSPSP